MKPALERALDALYGIWIGDTFGSHFEFESVDWQRPRRAFQTRELPPAIWRFTDDTLMACSVYHCLSKFAAINPDTLAQSFAQHFDIDRGYGSAAETLISDIKSGGNWSSLASAMFDGTGSYGNGSSMRVAPIGAFFSDNMEELIHQAYQSSIVTHTHPQGIAGAIAVAVANGIACQLSHKPPVKDFLDLIIPHLPSSQIKRKLYHALRLPDDISAQELAKQLGCGWDVSAMDTVPFALWMAAKYLDNFEEGLWHTISVGGDADTTGAIVGGIIAAYQGRDKLPVAWIQHSEALPKWIEE